MRFDFEIVRAIKQLHPGATINDVMLTIVAGGLRRFLQENKELPAASLVAGCPIDVRSPEEQMAGGNMVGFMGVSLCTHIEDPLERLRAVHEHSLQAKAYAAALGPRLALELTDLVPGNVLALGLRLAAATGLTESSVTFNTIVTNVPGPPIQQYFCGARLVDALSLGPLLPNIGLFHVVYSAVQNKQGSVTLSFTACREMLPEPGALCRVSASQLRRHGSAGGSAGARPAAGDAESSPQSPPQSAAAGHPESQPEDLPENRLRCAS